MDVRLPAPAGGRPPLALVAIGVGAVLLVAPLAAIASQGLSPLDRLDALMLALAGVVILGWGVLRTAGRRARLRHPTVVQLDGVGVTVRGPDVAATLAWSDVALVEVRWWEIVPPYVEEARHLPVLRFVAAHDADITVQGSPTISADLAHAFGISPAAAALSVVVGADGLEPLQEVLTWAGGHRPDVPVEVGAPPEL
ncbi:hypothetical protein [Nocardioides nitrophenolicus]|uniref:hypothetical protein n=1 Tax=Nocardioides nitrophenolicus TaxID=60489 RepID=UPI00195D479F|nr:hypothetical protein [Nocardioides nitrophenolicus]MBM7520241.1 hypothetical protein [Nocardioides nitrophenolicus]